MPIKPLTPADYAVIAAEDTWNTLSNTEIPESEVLKKLSDLCKKLKKHADNGHKASQIFLARYSREQQDWRTKISKKEIEEYKNQKYLKKLSPEEQEYLQAIKAGNYEIVNNYLMAGVNPFVRESENGYTALHIAAVSGYDKIVVLLLSYYKQYSLPIESLDNRQATPLGLACAHKHIKIIEMLLAAGANPFLSNQRYHRNAFGLASLSINKEVINTLTTYTNKSYCSLSYLSNNTDFTVRIDIASYGKFKEKFVGTLYIWCHPWNQSSDCDPALADINAYLQTQKNPPLSKSYDHNGGITIRLLSDQALQLLKYLEYKNNVTPNSKLESSDKSRTIPDLITAMKKTCFWSANASLQTLCMKSIVKSGVLDAKQLCNQLDLPEELQEIAYSQK